MEDIYTVWREGNIPLLVDPENLTARVLKPHVLVDSTMAKRNVGTNIDETPLVIGLGPGFSAGKDVDIVVETNRGHNLGRLIEEGEAEPNTGIPGEIGGYGAERVLRSPGDGIIRTIKDIGKKVREGDSVASVEGEEITTAIGGIVRGLLRDGTNVTKGLKIGDVDPRGDAAYCATISDKARTLGRAVLEGILHYLPAGGRSRDLVVNDQIE
jgi:xanthine dehydrogenase accessory factor